MIQAFSDMRRRQNILFLTLFTLGIAIPQPAGAESIGEFFRKLGNSIAHPTKHPSPRPHTEKPRSSASPSPVNATPAPSLTPQVPIKAAEIVTQARNSKRDVPYGIPVPNKDGFVTSPYAPSQGVVDVRGIPSGTEVKDPFTGKIFLTP
jgi:hypothetical protein